MKTKNDRLHKHGCIAGGLAALALLAASQAGAQSLCSIYTIQRGDTLSQIAAKAGVAGGYQLVFDMNANVLSNPNALEVGQRIALPCEDGTRPGATPPATATASTSHAPN
jgi:polar amino acid transport system substrate-binding protein